MDIDIARVARLSGTTSRTLRHYDDIGLLTPAWTGPDGRRHYGDDELVRLQHILVLRSLGTSLERIRRIVDTDSDATRIAQLRDHLDGLRAERDRYDRLIATVTTTIDSLEKGTPMNTDTMFDGFDHTQYEAEARERWGDTSVDDSNTAWKAMGEDGQRAHLAEHQAIGEELSRHAAEGHSPADAAVQAVVARHHAWVSRFWAPDAEAYRGLGRMYVDDPRFRETYDAFGPGTAELLRDAITVFVGPE